VTLDINVHDTYFVVAFSFGYGYICVVRYVCRNIPLVSCFGRMLNKNLGYIHFGLLLYVLMECFPMHFIGLAGLPGVITPTRIFHYLMT
jgi:cytochrome c oxidase subunit 1